MNQYLNKIINADCLDILKDIPDKSVDLVLTDPPYGINADKGVGGFGSSSDLAKKYNDNWDSFTPTKDYFTELLRVSKHTIIFGGNYFTDLIPVGTSWIVWDKIGEMKFQNPFSDCELAWTNFNKKTQKKYIVIQQGFIAKEKERFHPTQKPIELFSRILMDYSKENDIILDPFLGSGTTAIACIKTNRNFIGIEKEPKYCEIAQKRIDNELAQYRMAL